MKKSELRQLIRDTLKEQVAPSIPDRGEAKHALDCCDHLMSVYNNVQSIINANLAIPQSGKNKLSTDIYRPFMNKMKTIGCPPTPTVVTPGRSPEEIKQYTTPGLG
tara:strand:+ start:374 stop:691 length:318 start_codon:yes stop_codon:yes gene_type:complete